MTQPIPDTIRGLGDAVTPTWLNGPTFQAYRYAMSVILDDMVDTTSMSVRAAIPTYAPPDALQWIAQDRQIFQGPGEPHDAYVARLRQWLDTWRLAGSSEAVMLAILAYLTPLAPKIAVVQSALGGVTVWQTYAGGSQPFPAGSIIPTPPFLASTTNGQVTNVWDWDGSSQPYYYPWMRWRAWVVIQSNGAQAPWLSPTKTWGSFNWGDGTCLGWAGTAQQSAQLTALATFWKSAGTWVPWIIVSYNSAWVHASAASANLADGTWGYYGKVVTDAIYGTKYVSARPAASTLTCITGTSDGGNGLPLGLG
jgi:hypothetical protein